MNSRKARILIIASILLIFSLILIVISKYNKKDVILTEKNNKNKAISIMIETGLGTGVYELSEDDEWPGEGYSLNTTRSGCENGSSLSYNDRNNEVIIRGKISDKCYVYFDIIPPDIAINVSNLPETYGKLASINTSGAIAVYNNKLNQLEISNATTDKMDVSISFSTPTGTTPLNTYLIGLADTTQGDGKLVHEIGLVPDYNNSSIITSFGTTPIYFRNTTYSGTNRDAVNDYWTFNSTTGVFTSDPSKMTPGGLNVYFHAYMQVPSAGYYQVCYTIAKVSGAGNSLYITKNTSIMTSISASTVSALEGCYDAGYFSTTDYINISQNAYNGVYSPQMTFRIEKAENIVEPDTGYRYEGKNPNNYVMFNNELWRIMGVFSTEYDSNNDGTANGIENLVKIIRSDSLGNLSIHLTSNNDWTNSLLYNLFNEPYYDWDTYKSNVSSYCYQYSNSISGKCDYSIKGIHDLYRGMVVNAKWYLGGPGKTGYTTYKPANTFIYERDSNAVYTGRSASTLGYIGLMYASDYLYGALESDCDRTTRHTAYSSQKCTGKNWLRGYGYEWTLTQASNSESNFLFIGYRGDLSSNVAYYGYSIRPVLYLSPFVYKISGSGTITDPYIIGM